MSKLTCMEAVTRTLFGPVNAEMETPIYNALVMGCTALATGEASQDNVIDWIVEHSKGKGEIEICMEILRYYRLHRVGTNPSEVLEKAVKAGREAL